MPKQEHMFKRTPIILHQRYWNHRLKQVETLIDVRGHMMITNCQEIHEDYFRDVYTFYGNKSTKKEVCTYPECLCPFDMGSDGKCLLGKDVR